MSTFVKVVTKSRISCFRQCTVEALYTTLHIDCLDICKKLISLKHCVRSQITRLKMQKSFCDLEHGASL